MHKTTDKGTPRTLAILLLVAGTLMLQALQAAAGNIPAPAAQDPANGATVFARAGCAGCHGNEGQGMVGPALMGTSLATEDVSTKVRGGGHAPFGPEAISDEELADLYAWLAGGSPAPGLQVAP